MKVIKEIPKTDLNLFINHAIYSGECTKNYGLNDTCGNGCRECWDKALNFKSVRER